MDLYSPASFSFTGWQNGRWIQLKVCCHALHRMASCVLHFVLELFSSFRLLLYTLHYIYIVPGNSDLFSFKRWLYFISFFIKSTVERHACCYFTSKHNRIYNLLFHDLSQVPPPNSTSIVRHSPSPPPINYLANNSFTCVKKDLGKISLQGSACPIKIDFQV